MSAPLMTPRGDLAESEPIRRARQDWAEPASYPNKGTSENSTLSQSRFLDAEGPLVSGPLDPLVPTGRVQLGQRVATWLEKRWLADDLGTFRCPLPGHGGTARLVDQEGDLRLGCCLGRWRSVGEVFSAEAYGLDRLRTNIEIATWTRRLAYEAGVFEPLAVPVPELPEEASEAAHLVRDGFVVLIGLRWKDGPHRPVAFSVRFCAAWCQMSHKNAYTAITELVQLGVIYEAGRKGRVRLFLPSRMVPAAVARYGGQA